MPLSSAQMNSIVSAGGSVGYRGTLITQVTQVPSDAQIAADAAVDFAGTHPSPYDAYDSYLGPPTASQAVYGHIAARFYAVLPTGGVLISRVAATATAVFSVQKNGVQIGTATFVPGTTSAPIVIGAAVLFNPGDLLTVVAPATTDATLTDLDITIAAQA